MGHFLVPRYHVQLDFSQIKDPDRHEIVAGIRQVAQTSPIILNSPAMQASLAALTAKDAALTQANAAGISSKQKLKTDIATEAGCRGDVDGEIRAFATLTENYAKSPADIHGAGLPSRSATPTKKLPPEVPASIDTVIPRAGLGKAIVSVHDTGKTRKQYAAEWSPDPIGPDTWAPLGVGSSKVRTVTGASGTKVWVRFATVRGQLQSDWCTPVLVTIP
jgi:hypothetical protein